MNHLPHTANIQFHANESNYWQAILNSVKFVYLVADEGGLTWQLLAPQRSLKL